MSDLSRNTYSTRQVANYDLEEAAQTTSLLWSFSYKHVAGIPLVAWRTKAKAGLGH